MASKSDTPVAKATVSKTASVVTAKTAPAPKAKGGGNTESATGAAASGIAPATKFDPSGAPMQTVPGVDASHPAVDADPRANTSEDQNRIDFNDPSLSGAEAVQKNLAEQQGKKE